MTPTTFSESNCTFGPPEDFAESQVMKIPAWRGQMNGGPVDGVDMVVVAWKPDAADLERLNAGNPIYVAMMKGLAPHFLTTESPIK